MSGWGREGCYAAWMRQGFRLGRSRGPKSVGCWLSVLLAVVAGCGGKSKEGTRETRVEDGDASLDGGLTSGDGGLQEAGGHGYGSGGQSSGTNGSETRSGNTGVTTVNTMPVATTSPVTTSPVTTGPAMTSGSPLRPDWVPVESVAESLSNCSGKLEQNNRWCSYQTLCGTVKLNSRCERDGVAWQCTCELGDSPRSYSLTGVEEGTPCVASLEVCSPDRKRDPSPVCDVEIERVSAEECQVLEVCRTTMELKDGHTATAVDKNPLNDCATDPDTGDVYCSCAKTGGYARVEGLPVEQTCEALVPACNAELSPGDDEKVCADADFVYREGYCSLTQECGVRMDLEGGYALFSPGPQQVACSQEEGCQCLGTHTLSLNASGELTEDRCDVAHEFCHGGVTASPVGEISVSEVETKGAEGSCLRFADISQWASWDTDKSVQLTSNIDVQCTRDGTGWQCSCKSGTNSSPVFSVTGTNANAVCDEAFTRCVTRAKLTGANAAVYVAGKAFEFLPESAVDGDAGP